MSCSLSVTGIYLQSHAAHTCLPWSSADLARLLVQLLEPSSKSDEAGTVPFARCTLQFCSLKLHWGIQIALSLHATQLYCLCILTMLLPC